MLEGDGLIDGITISDGEVTVNLLLLVARGLVVVQDLGLLTSVEVPTITAAGDPDVQRAELASALGSELPPTFGELVVYRGEAVAAAEAMVQVAQRMVVLAKRAMLAVVVLSLRWLSASRPLRCNPLHARPQQHPGGQPSLPSPCSTISPPWVERTTSASTSSGSPSRARVGVAPPNSDRQ